MHDRAAGHSCICSFQQPRGAGASRRPRSADCHGGWPRRARSLARIPQVAKERHTRTPSLARLEAASTTHLRCLPGTRARRHREARLGSGKKVAGPAPRPLPTSRRPCSAAQAEAKRGSGARGGGGGGCAAGEPARCDPGMASPPRLAAARPYTEHRGARPAGHSGGCPPPPPPPPEPRARPGRSEPRAT